VSQELKLVSDYLEIQQVRLGDRLRFEITTDPDARGRIPPFSLQTLVENSLRHVGSKRPEGVAVRVRARAAGPDLVLEVTDDGPGFDPDRMKAGHGLDTLAGRLRALYGERATLDFRRAPGAMTVEVRVPST
jgi:LytS/YehU family sensor histidine kinase